MQNIQELLDQCRKSVEDLVDEMENYKSMAELHSTSTKNLKGIADALSRTMKEIEPYTESKMRQHMLITYIGFGVNAFLLLLVLVLK